MNVVIATPKQIEELSKLSVRVGNIPFSPDCIAAMLLDEEGETVGFAAVNRHWHAAGSWIKEELRGQNLSYNMRNVLDGELRKRGVQVYFAIPNTTFERGLFEKYGHTTEHLVQVRHL